MAHSALQADISASLNELERRLAIDPLNEGESRHDNERVAFQLPLGIDFTVDSATMTVNIERVWLID